MAASRDTLRAVFDLLAAELAPIALLRLVEKLRQVEGNQSFRQSVERLAEIAQKRYVR